MRAFGIKSMSRRTPLTEEEVADLQSHHPALPAGYLRYLREVGWGEAESGRMIYSGPVSPRDIYGSRCEGSQILLVGDDTQGYCFGFDRVAGRWGEFDASGNWTPWREDRPFSDYVESPED
jgi:hypothetical protein